MVEVVRDSPAEHAGLRPEDLIVAVDGHGVEGVDDLQRLMVGEVIGRPVTLYVLRADRALELSIVPERESADPCRSVTSARCASSHAEKTARRARAGKVAAGPRWS